MVEYPDWATDLQIEIGELIYFELLRSDPHPTDVAWEDLDERSRESYLHIAEKAETVIRARLERDQL